MRLLGACSAAVCRSKRKACQESVVKAVIPGSAEGASPESIIQDQEMKHGFGK
jgi:hypothetical protein